MQYILRFPYHPPVLAQAAIGIVSPVEGLGKLGVQSDGLIQVLERSSAWSVPVI